MRRLTCRLPDLSMLVSLPAAVYPDGSEPTRGPVVIHEAAQGVVVEVAARGYAGASEDAQVVELFATGSSWFPTAHHWFRFCLGPLADAFGAESAAVRVPTVRRARPGGPQLRIAGADAAGRASGASRTILPARLSRALGERVFGQEPALERLAVVVSTHVAKRRPARPATILMVGPTGVGKTSSVVALPRALRTLGSPVPWFVHRVDCSELTEPIQVTRLIGASPGYVGFQEKPPLIKALRRPGCILLLDEIEKAHPSILQAVLLNLFDAGRITSALGKSIDARGAIIALTSNLAIADLEERLERVPTGDRVARERTCQEHLVGCGLSHELVGRIGAYAVFGRLAGETQRRAAYLALHDLAAEYLVDLVDIDPVLADVVVDIAAASRFGARALHHAARDLVGETLASLAGTGARSARLVAGPPPCAVAAAAIRRA